MIYNLLCIICLTNLGEALRMARDFGYLCETEFPSRHVAEYTCKQHLEHTDVLHRRQTILSTKLENTIASFN